MLLNLKIEEEILMLATTTLHSCFELSTEDSTSTMLYLGLSFDGLYLERTPIPIHNRHGFE